MNQDPNYIVKLEKAISEKYGPVAIKNPKSGWDKAKEEEYLKQLKQEDKKLKSKEENQKLIKNRSKIARSCNLCQENKIKKVHDLYFTKFECCFDCYIQWIEGREQRWKSGWRPKIEYKELN
jgi:hypothetical protein